MEGTIITLLIIIIIILVVNNNKNIDRLRYLKDRLSDILLRLYVVEKKNDELSAKIDDLVFAKQEVHKQPDEDITNRQITEEITTEPLKSEPSTQDPTTELEKIAESELAFHETVNYQSVDMGNKEDDENPDKATPSIGLRAMVSSFFGQYPDLERFIGENLLNKIGIAVLVLGITFVVKYAIDNEYINEVGRVMVGLLSGGLLIGTAHRLRKNFKAFSSVLIGGGLAVLYFTVAYAFHQYNLIPQEIAFVVMILITAFAVILSIAYNRIELAILAILGGYGTPIMISTGGGNYIVLFTYITILNLGMLVLAFFKKWHPVNTISYIFTILLFGGWLIKEFMYETASVHSGALVFATIFYLTFFFMNIVFNIKNTLPFKAKEILILISNSFLYYIACMFIFHDFAPGFKGLFTAAMAIFNFAFAYHFYVKNRIDKNLVYLLIGLVLSFVSLIAPVQLEGNYITLFWAAEAVLLLWMAIQTKMKIIEKASFIINIIMLVSLFIDWEKYYFSFYVEAQMRNIIFNKVFLTGFATSVSLLISCYVISQRKDMKTFFFIDKTIYKYILLISGVVVVYFTGLFETNFHVRAIFDSYSVEQTIVGLYNFAFILAAMLVVNQYQIAETKKWIVVAGIFSGVIYLLYYQLVFRNLATQFVTNTTISGFQYSIHFAPLVLLLIINILCVIILKRTLFFNHQIHKYLPWYFSFIFVFIFSAELDNISITTFYTPENGIYVALNNSHRIGFPILWGISSFALMLAGMKTNNRVLRIISITLFLLTIAKLFVVDVWDMSEAGRIAAFVVLGIFLLVVSFLYQKLKKIIFEKNTD